MKMKIASEIELFLYDIDNDFSPPLSSRMNIANYAAKIIEKATIFSINDQGRLNAFVAVYCNDTDRKFAYLTIMAVGKQYRGKGIAFILLRTCIEYLKMLNFNYLKLEVYKNNPRAIAIYKNFGFEIIDENNTSFFMRLSIS